jgi:hypothetical protein
MILKVLGPCLTLAACSRCMNVVENVCKLGDYSIESTWDAHVCLCYLRMLTIIMLYEIYAHVEVGFSKIT